MIDEGEALLAPALVPAGVSEVAALSQQGRLLVFPLEEVKELAVGGKGVMVVRLHEGERMLGLRPVEEAVKVAIFGRGDKRTALAVSAAALEHYRGPRARTGRVLQGYFKRVEGFE